jgi:hypothetical protein
MQPARRDGEERGRGRESRAKTEKEPENLKETETVTKIKTETETETDRAKNRTCSKGSFFRYSSSSLYFLSFIRATNCTNAWSSRHPQWESRKAVK